jgi:hypothetical protein
LTYFSTAFSAISHRNQALDDAAEWKMIRSHAPSTQVRSQLEMKPEPRAMDRVDGFADWKEGGHIAACSFCVRCVGGVCACGGGFAFFVIAEDRQRARD